MSYGEWYSMEDSLAYGMPSVPLYLDMVSYCWGAPLALPPVSLTTSPIIQEDQDEYPHYQQVLSCHKTCTLDHIQFLGPRSHPTSHPDSSERVRIRVLLVSLCSQIVVFPLATSTVAKQAQNRKEFKYCPGHETWLLDFERNFWSTFRQDGE
jgi:hypothetical protein